MKDPLYVEIYILIARLFFALLFILTGLNHLMNLGRTAEYVRQMHFPFPKLTVLISGTAIIFGGMMILIGFWVKAGAIILTLFLITTAFFSHNFWEREDPGEKANEMSHFLKDIALAGASLMIWYFGTGPVSLSN